MQCLTLTVENPAKAGEYRVFNQFEETYDVTELANKVREVALELGLKGEIHNLENPRIELEDHYYKPDHKHLLDLGYKPTHDMAAELRIMMADLIKNRGRIEAKREVLIPKVRWDGTSRKSRFL
jgi:UDP-sulfoquinovose synthase